MRNHQWIILSVVLCLTFVAVQHVSAGGGRAATQCSRARQFFNQWWPGSALATTFQTVCCQVGATQAWTLLQGLLGVPATGVLDQATFQALLNNGNHALLAQQLLALIGGGIIPGGYPGLGK